MPAFLRPALFKRFIRKFGRRDAKRQLTWLNNELAASAPVAPVVRWQDRPSLTGLLSRLLRDEPLAYVIGTQPFGSLNLRVAPPVLIPRSETEEWTYELLKRLEYSYASKKREDWRVLDLCTGSGCIPLLLCKEWPHHHFPGSVSAYGVDIGDKAISLATQNASRTLSSDAHTPRSFQAKKFDIFHPDFEEWISDMGGFDIITSNPPYIPQKDWELLPRSVKEFEDRRALQGGEDGLSFYRRIAQLLKGTPLFRPDGFGLLAVEFGIHQAEDVKRVLEDTGKFGSVDVWRDCFGIQRAAFCRVRIK